ncbi:MAG: DMT family transporter [Acidimicrobiia bacterium]
MSSLLAVFAAISFAFGTVLQQRGTLATEAPEGDPRFLAEIVRKPVWIAGASCQALGWVLQAIALDGGSLVVVQSLCALSLVFALPLGVRFTHQQVGLRSVLGAVWTLVGIILFVAVGQPQGGSSLPGAGAWWIATVVCLTGMSTLAGIARRRGGAAAASLFATSAGIAFGFQSAVTKVFVTELGGGLVGVLTMWTTYGLIISALAGFALQQSALKTGFLAPAMAASNASTLVISVVLGIAVFGESLTKGGWRVSPAVLGLVLAVIGVVMLSTPERQMSSS